MTLPAEIVKEADALVPHLDLAALSLSLLEKYLRHQRRKLLALQYQKYYEALSQEDRAEEEEILSDFAAFEAEIDAFIEAEEGNGSV